MKLYLAPMEGVVDWVMRDMLTQIGGIDQCVTEFLRVTTLIPPDHIFYKICPELKTSGQTRSGVPVFVQILGGHAEPMALSAQRAAQLGAPGIDINFGCPAPTVNRHDGGATILKSCDRVFEIVSQVRKAVPVPTPVTVKIRLGFEEPTKCVDIAQAVQEAGADLLTIHCRTKTDGYKPPAYWEWIPKIKEKVSLPLVANGEIWNLSDFERCQKVTGVDRFMIGRGALANPFIFKRIKEWAQQNVPEDKDWIETKTLIPGFFEANQNYSNEKIAVLRTKQWLKSLALQNLEAKEIFEEIKILTLPMEFQSRLERLCQ